MQLYKYKYQHFCIPIGVVRRRCCYHPYQLFGNYNNNNIDDVRILNEQTRTQQRQQQEQQQSRRFGKLIIHQNELQSNSLFVLYGQCEYNNFHCIKKRIGQQYYSTITRHITTGTSILTETQQTVSTDNITASTSSTTDKNLTGEELYQQYLSILDTIQQIENDKERSKSEKMYKAWKRVEEKTTSNKSDSTSTETNKTTTQTTTSSSSNITNRNYGIAITRTLAKHTKQELEQKQSNEQHVQSLMNKANDLLVTAGTVYKHSNALVVLGNQQLEQAQRNNDNTTIVQRKEHIQQAFAYYQQSQSAEGLYNIGHTMWTGIRNNFSTVQSSNDNSKHECDDHDEEWVLEPNQQSAMDVFLQAARNYNDYDAMYFVGVEMISSSSSSSDDVAEDDMEKRRQQGLQWIQTAADTGHHGGALYYLALLYLNGNMEFDIEPCSGTDFVQRLNTAIESDTAVPDAYFLRGNCYYHGEHGYEQDYQKALDDFVIAADMGHADAAVSAGAIYFNGSTSINGKIIIQTNQRRAFEYYQLGGELGSKEGWRNVVACYANGDGVPRSIEMAKYIAKTMLSNDD